MVSNDAQKSAQNGNAADDEEKQSGMMVSNAAQKSAQNGNAADNEENQSDMMESKPEEAPPLGEGLRLAFLISLIISIGLMVGAVFSCSFLTVEPGGLLQTRDGGPEYYKLGLFKSDMWVPYRPKFDEVLQKTVWFVLPEHGGCLPYGQARDGPEDYALYGPQQAARALSIVSVGIGTLLLLYQSCPLADFDGEGRRLCYPKLSSALLLLAGICGLLSLLFLDHTWCDETFYGTCQMGSAAVLAILGGISFFACSGTCWIFAYNAKMINIYY